MVGFSTLPTLFPAAARERNLIDVIEQNQLIRPREIGTQTLVTWAEVYLETHDLVHAPLR